MLVSFLNYNLVVGKQQTSLWSMGFFGIVALRNEIIRGLWMVITTFELTKGNL